MVEQVLYIILALIGLLGLFFLSRKRELFPFLMVFVLGLEYFSPDFGQSVFTIPKVGMATIAFGYLFTNGFRISLRATRIFVPLLIFVLYCFMSTIWSIDQSRSLTRSITLFLLLLNYAILVSYVRSNTDLRRFWQAFLVYGCLSAVFAIIQIVYGLRVYEESYGARAGGFGVNPSEGAFYMGIALMIALSYQLRRETCPVWLRSVKIRTLVTALLSIGILITGSRGGIIAVCTGIGFLLFPRTGGKRNSKKRFITAMMFTLTVIAVVSFLPVLLEAISIRVAQQDRLGNRVDIFEALWSSFLENPYFGQGLSSTFAVTRDSRFNTYSPHNTPLGILVDGGVVGGALFLLIFITVVVTLRRISASHLREISGNGIILSSIFLLSFVLMLSYDIQMNKLFWVCIALAEGCYLLLKRSNKTVLQTTNQLASNSPLARPVSKKRLSGSVAGPSIS